MFWVILTSNFFIPLIIFYITGTFFKDIDELTINDLIFSYGLVGLPMSLATAPYLCFPNPIRKYAIAGSLTGYLTFLTLFIIQISKCSGCGIFFVFFPVYMIFNSVITLIGLIFLCKLAENSNIKSFIIALVLPYILTFPMLALK